MFRCNCPYETRSACADPRCPHHDEWLRVLEAKRRCGGDVSAMESAMVMYKEDAMKSLISKGTATWECETIDIAGNLWYIKLDERKSPPYLRQKHVEAIIDVDEEGNVAGIELIDDMPAAPSMVLRDEIDLWEK